HNVLDIRDGIRAGREILIGQRARLTSQRGRFGTRSAACSDNIRVGTFAMGHALLVSHETLLQKGLPSEKEHAEKRRRRTGRSKQAVRALPGSQADAQICALASVACAEPVSYLCP